MADLKKILSAAAPVAANLLAGPGPGGMAFNQSFQNTQQQMQELAMQQEAKREARRRENAMLLFETFQNNPAAFQAMEPEQLQSIMEPVAEATKMPLETLMGMSQAIVGQAGKPTPGQALSVVPGLLGADQIGAAEDILQGQGFDVQLDPVTEKGVIDDKLVVKLKETFTSESVDPYLEARTAGLSPAEAARFLEIRDDRATGTFAEQSAKRAAEFLNQGLTPQEIREQDPTAWLGYEKYFNIEDSFLSPAQIAGIYKSAVELPSFILSLKPDDKKAIRMFNNSAAVAKDMAKGAQELADAIGRVPTETELTLFAQHRAQQIYEQGGVPKQQEGTSPSEEDKPADFEGPQLPDETVEITPEVRAAFNQARKELGPGAQTQEVIARAKEILGG